MHTGVRPSPGFSCRPRSLLLLIPYTVRPLFADVNVTGEGSSVGTDLSHVACLGFRCAHVDTEKKWWLPVPDDSESVVHGISGRSTVSTLGMFKQNLVMFANLSYRQQSSRLCLCPCLVFSQSLRHGGVREGKRGSYFIEFIEQFLVFFLPCLVLSVASCGGTHHQVSLPW